MHISTELSLSLSLSFKISVQEMAKRLGEEGQEEEDGNGQENQDVDNDDLNIYHILARLQRRVELQQKSIQDRSRTVSSLLTKIQEFTKIMGPQNGWEEGQDNKDEDNDSLSLSRIARLENLVATLELEKV